METTNQDELLKVKSLKISFYLNQGQVKAVDDVNISISKKSAVGLVGESGCGKTTTALSIVRLLPSPPSKILDGMYSPIAKPQIFRALPV